uniref:Chorion peroxidase n=1 Tax=Panagrellus redivivus TaxID=6233 RepID=A0A7E4VE02_PANRE
MSGSLAITTGLVARIRHRDEIARIGMSRPKLATLLAISCLATVIPLFQTAHISCGKSFIPCENDITPADVRPRIYGISSAKFTRQQVPAPLVIQTANEAMREVHGFFNDTETSDIDSKMPLSSPLSQYCHLHPMTERAKSFSESAYVSGVMSLRLKRLGLRDAEITQGLDPEILVKSALGDICPRAASDSCPNSEYRPIGGGCNNVKNPLWGAAYEPLARLLPPTYNDGVMVPRQSKTNQALPNTREVSLKLFDHPSKNQEIVNEMTAFWLYFVASDISESIPNQALKTNGGYTPLPCCNPGFLHPDCDFISIPDSDTFYLKSGVTCLPYVRSLPAPREFCKLGHREQISVVTSYLDGSPIYGSSAEQTNKLRAKTGGLMQTSVSGGVRDLAVAMILSRLNGNASSVALMMSTCFPKSAVFIRFS